MAGQQGEEDRGEQGAAVAHEIYTSGLAGELAYLPEGACCRARGSSCSQWDGRVQCRLCALCCV